MEDLGHYLKELRESSGISYEQIWEDIRLREDQIKLIEENNLFQLGDFGFCKVLIFNYSRYLNADSAKVMSEFHILMPDTIKGRFVPAKPVKEKKIMLSTNFLWTVGIVIFVLILSSILFTAYQNGYLSSPNIFAKDKADNKPQVDETRNDVARPDSLREHMRMLTEGIPKDQEIPTKANKSATKPSRISDDTTDYIGEQMGKSPINIDLN